MGVHWKIRFLGWEGAHEKKQYIKENCLKKGRGLGQFADFRRGAWKKRWEGGGGVFEGGWYTSVHYECPIKQ